MPPKTRKAVVARTIFVCKAKNLNFFVVVMSAITAKPRPPRIMSEVRAVSYTHLDVYKRQVGVQLSRLCANPILEYGMKALKDNENHVLSKEFEQVVLAIVVSTGLVSNFVESDYNGHIAHAFYCTITMLPQIEEKHLQMCIRDRNNHCGRWYQ